MRGEARQERLRHDRHRHLCGEAGPLQSFPVHRRQALRRKGKGHRPPGPGPVMPGERGQGGQRAFNTATRKGDNTHERQTRRTSTLTSDAQAMAKEEAKCSSRKQARQDNERRSSKNERCQRTLNPKGGENERRDALLSCEKNSRLRIGERIRRKECMEFRAERRETTGETRSGQKRKSERGLEGETKEPTLNKHMICNAKSKGKGEQEKTKEAKESMTERT